MNNLDEERWDNYYKLPEIILEIMNWLCSTRFYKKTYTKRKEEYKEIKENWKFCDFVVINGTLEKPIVIKIGQLPRYKGDHEISIEINFRNIDYCYLIRGYATGLYASKVIQNRYPIPKYMKNELNNFIKKYNKSKGETNE